MRKIQSYDETYFHAQLAKSDDKIAWQYGRLLEWADVRVASARILDVGCGAGPALRYLARRGSVPFGSDLVEYPLRAARQLVPEARLVQCDADLSLPFADESFDAVLLSEVIEHLADPALTLREIRRVLRAAGVVALTTPNLWDVRRVYYPLLGRVWSGEADRTHRTLFNPLTLRAILEGAGFRGVRVGAGFKPLGWLSSRKLRVRVPLPGLPLIGNTLVAVGYKR